MSSGAARPAQEFRAAYDDDRGVLSVHGEVDGDAVATFAELLTCSAASTDRLVVDLSGVTFFPSSAIGALVVAMTSHDGLEVVAAQDSIVDRVLSICAVPHRTT